MKCVMLNRITALTSRSPCGERGLKSLAGVLSGIRPVCRSPCGERGLKFSLCRKTQQSAIVAPRAGSVD